MTSEFLQRIRKEFSLTLTGFHETLLAISERVNRKVNILKLHWQASAIFHQIESIQQDAGDFLAKHLAQGDARSTQPPNRPEIDARLSAAATRTRLLKNELQQVDALVRELEADTLRDDLLKVQRDLFTRSATMERLVVTEGTSACGRTIGQLDLGPAVRVAAVLRGPALIAVVDTLSFRAGDIVLLVGPREELKTAPASFLEKQRASA
ncbi:MAG: TrkA C-terminal domain-containing protein [Nitrospirae bacterium]|nr:TrkA C-terminal domain-containing protein [Nitrospirota bacterium]